MVTANLTPSGGEEDDTAVPPRLGERSQGTQEGYSPAEREAELEAPPPGAGDNLEVIKGIGPRYAAQLAEMGITTFGALINTPLDELTVAFPRVTAEELRDWIEQARELSESNL
jgi:predicted flap endonuclease-1-like 5' DNA nuclease